MGPEANASQARVTGSAGNSIVRSIFDTLTLTRKPAPQEIPAPELETARDQDGPEQAVSSDEFTLLTTMLVEVKFELANTQEEVMRLKRDLKRCINDKLEACRRVRISLFILYYFILFPPMYRSFNPEQYLLWFKRIQVLDQSILYRFSFV